jgi:tetrapyrrole methylase family protein/MazG family protein
MFVHELSAILSAFGLESVSRLMIIDGSAHNSGHVPSFPPDAPALLVGLEKVDLAQLRQILFTVYPQSFMLKMIDKQQKVSEILLSDLNDCNAQAVFVPALGIGTSFEAFQEIIAHLRAPEDGCPWDKEQTHLTLRKHLLEETYETLAALDEEDPIKMREEFGDLLLQIVLNAQIATEKDEFNMALVLKGIYDKIVRRHPHVFGEVSVNGVADVLANWEMIKAGERKKDGELNKGVLDGLPGILPALVQAQEFQDRAARVGFDWPEIDGVLEKIKEEIEEVRAAVNPVELADELGDLFFALVNLARWKKIDAESALRGASLKFKKRFKYVESRAQQIQRSMQEMSLKELDDLWNDAKKNLRA